MWARKNKKLTQDVWKRKYCASVYSSCRELWDILIGGGCVGEMMLLGHAGPFPAGNGNGTPFILPLQWLGLEFWTQDSRRGTSNFSSYHLFEVEAIVQLPYSLIWAVEGNKATHQGQQLESAPPARDLMNTCTRDPEASREESFPFLSSSEMGFL